MKKTYLKPSLQVVTVQQQGVICTSEVQSVNSNAGITGAGTDGEITGSDGPARVRHSSVDWEDWE